MDRITDLVSSVLVWVGGILLAAITLMTGLDVAMRYLFAAPMRGVVELVQLGLPLVVFLGLGLVSRGREHISVSLLEPALGPRLTRGYRFLNMAFTVLGAGLVAYVLYGVAHDYREWRQTSLVLRLDLWPLVAAMAGLGAVAAILGLVGPCRGAGRDAGAEKDAP